MRTRITTLLIAGVLTATLAGCSGDSDPNPTDTDESPSVIVWGENINFSDPKPSEKSEAEEDIEYINNNLPSFTLSEDAETLVYRAAGAPSCPPEITSVNYYEEREIQVEVYIASQAGTECELEVSVFTQDITLPDGKTFPEDVRAVTFSPESGKSDA